MSRLEKTEIRPSVLHTFWLALSVTLMSAVPPVVVYSMLDGSTASWLGPLSIVGALALIVMSVILYRRDTIVISADRIERRELVRKRMINRLQVKGWRNFEGSILLIGREGVRSMALPNWSSKSEVLHEWLSDLPNLDAIQYEAELAEAMSDTGLGSTPEARTRSLRIAQTTASALTLFSLAAMAWIFVFPVFYPFAIFTGLLTPLVAIVLIIADRRRFCLIPPGLVQVPIGLFPLLGVGAALTLRAIDDFGLENWWPSIGAGLIAAAVVTLGLARLDASIRHPVTMGLAGVFVAGWLWGAMVIGNGWNDPSGVLQPVRIQSIQDNRQLVGATSDGRRHTLDASDSIAEAARQGTQICLLERDGRFGWKHSRLFTCPGLTVPVVGKS